MARISRYQTASGATLYSARYYTPDRGETQRRGFTTKRDAEAFAATVEVSKLKGEYVAPALGRATVGKLASDLARSQTTSGRTVALPDVGVGVAGPRRAAVGCGQGFRRGRAQG
jgi:hypothetical protein